MSPAWSAILVALISGPIMWVLYRLDKRNTEQHGNAVDLIRQVKNDVKEVKDIQVWTNLKIDQQGDVIKQHLEDHKNNGDNPVVLRTAERES